MKIKLVSKALQLANYDEIQSIIVPKDTVLWPTEEMIQYCENLQRKSIVYHGVTDEMILIKHI